MLRKEILRRLVMKNFTLVMFLLGFFTQHCYAVDWHRKKVSQVQVHAVKGCIYFTLDGVDEADPVVPNQPWFTLGPDNPYQKEFFSLLMLAYAAKADVRIATSGKKEPGCGYAQVLSARLQ